MIKFLITILAATMLIANSLQSAEVIPVWMNFWKQGGWVNDFEFLRGEDHFILIAGVDGAGAVEIRETLTGELISSFPLPNAYYFNQIEITPDSNRIVITTGGSKADKPAIELRSIENFELIKKLEIKMDADSLDKLGRPYFYHFNDIVIDPIKPLIYAFITKTNNYNDDDDDRTWLRVYNYETMEEIRDLTPKGYENEQMTCMDVSDDGRLLAVLNEGKAYLKIWNTETFALITDKQLYDNNFFDPEDYWCKAGDIEFSHKDNDLIYFSGTYPGEGIKSGQNGLYKYLIDSDKLNLIFGYSGIFNFFDNQERVLVCSGVSFQFINLMNQKVELNVSPTLEYPFGEKVILAKKYNLFIGYSLSYIGSLKYDSQTSVISDYEEEFIISPNPTSSSLRIELGKERLITSYKITDANGKQVLKDSLSPSSSVIIDVESLLVGVYIIELTTSSGDVVTDKFVKE